MTDSRPKIPDIRELIDPSAENNAVKCKAMLRREISAVLKEADPRLEWQHTFSGAKFDPGRLAELGWFEVARDDRGAWLRKFNADGDGQSTEIRVFISITNTLLDVLLFDNSPSRPVNELRMPVNENNPFILEQMKILKANIAAPLVDDPVWEVEQLAPGLTYDEETGKDLTRALKHTSFVLQMTEEFKDLHRPSLSRLLAGASRWPEYWEHGAALAMMALTGFQRGYRSEPIILLNAALKQDDDNSEFWNYTGCAFEQIGHERSALDCFIMAVKHDPEEKLFQDNAWLMGKRSIRELLAEHDFRKALSLLDRLIQYPGTSSEEDRGQVMAALGLCCEGLGLLEEAADRYGRALELDSDCLIARLGINRLNSLDGKARSRAFADQLGAFPETPGEAGINGMAPVEYVEGGVHGDHWEALIEDVEKFIPTFLPLMVEKGIHGSSAEVPRETRVNGGWDRVSSFAYPKEAPLHGCALVAQVDGEDHFELVSAFPVYEEAPPLSLVVSSLEEWENGIEGLVRVRQVSGGTLCFFDPGYFKNRHLYKKDHSYDFSLAAFAYQIDLAEDQEFEVNEGPLVDIKAREENKEPEPVTLRLSREARILFPDFGNMCEFEYMLPVNDVAWINFLGSEVCQISTCFDHDDHEQPLTLFVGKHLLKDFTPTQGDAIEGLLWLQGHLKGTEGRPIPEKDETEPDSPYGSMSWRRSMGEDSKRDIFETASRSAVANRDGLKSYAAIRQRTEAEPHFVVEGLNGVRVLVHVVLLDGEAADWDLVRQEKNEKATQYDGPLSLYTIVLTGVRLKQVGKGYSIEYFGWDELDTLMKTGE